MINADFHRVSPIQLLIQSDMARNWKGIVEILYNSNADILTEGRGPFY